MNVKFLPTFSLLVLAVIQLYNGPARQVFNCFLSSNLDTQPNKFTDARKSTVQFLFK